MKKNLMAIIIMVGLFVFISCKPEDNSALNNSGTSPVLNDFYIVSDIDSNSNSKTTLLDSGIPYYARISITDEDKDADSITLTQTRKSDSYIVGPETTKILSSSDKTFIAHAELIPDLPGIWDVSVFVNDLHGNKSNTLTLEVVVYESGKYTIIFDGNGATSGEMKKQILSVGERLNANGFMKDGYLFAGWNCVSDGSDVGYKDEEEFSIKTIKEGNKDFSRKVTLYAQWINEESSKVQISINNILPEIDSFRIDGVSNKNEKLSKTWNSQDEMISDVLFASAGNWRFVLTAIVKSTGEVLQGDVSNKILKGGEKYTINFDLSGIKNGNGVGKILCSVIYPVEENFSVTAILKSLDDNIVVDEKELLIQEEGNAVYENDNVKAGEYILSIWFYKMSGKQKIIFYSYGQNVLVVANNTSKGNIYIDEFPID
jgi:hypothetical protein